jgi:hypothetical protein
MLLEGVYWNSWAQSNLLENLELMWQSPPLSLYAVVCLLIGLPLYTINLALTDKESDFSYLRYRLSCVESSPAANKQKDFKNFSELVYRCLSSMPSRFPVLHRQDQTWVDFTYHNEVIDLYIRLLTEENIYMAYEKFMQMMPTNVGLITR